MQHDASLGVVDDKGWTALHYAAYHNNTGCARLLINRGAILDLQDNGIAQLSRHLHYIAT